MNLRFASCIIHHSRQENVKFFPSVLTATSYLINYTPSCPVYAGNSIVDYSLQELATVRVKSALTKEVSGVRGDVTH